MIFKGSELIFGEHKMKFFSSVALFLFSGVFTYASDPSLLSLIKTLPLTTSDLLERSKAEIDAFVKSKLWEGGYFDVDPTNPSDAGSYSYLLPYKGGRVSVYYISYLECLVSQIDHIRNKHVLEIGPGRGAWTKAILDLGAEHITCVDALSAEHNKFCEYVGLSDRITYHAIRDCSLDELRDDSIDFVFSFGTFCHISPFVTYEYLRNVYKKMRSGSEGFIMYADYDKCNQYYFISRWNHRSRYLVKQDDSTLLQMPIDPGCWYHMGIERMQEVLLSFGYEIIQADMGINERDPIVHFRKA